MSKSKELPDLWVSDNWSVERYIPASRAIDGAKLRAFVEKCQADVGRAEAKAEPGSVGEYFLRGQFTLCISILAELDRMMGEPGRGEGWKSTPEREMVCKPIIGSEGE